MTTVHKQSYQLSEVKELISNGSARSTITAQQFAHELGFTRTEIMDTVLSLEKGDFFHSINERANHKSWQDVYKKEVRGILLYIKLKIASVGDREVVILSFKRDGELRGKP